MKKRKIYEISVIDKTYSKTISDETKFYTSDTALELGFELKETEYTFESAEIVLLNIDDRSLVTRPVTKSSDSFGYVIDDDITAHYGEWRGQLRFEQSGEIYVSSPVKFRIENDLSNDRPPQLSDVQSWISLKRYADGLVDELKQAVLSVEGIEDTFNTNETVRQNQFSTAEQSHQTTFETNESERDETFNTNESARQTQELEREGAEATRQQAETQRASAESSRVSAEAQRKIDHEKRSAELAGKADKVVLKNEVINGDFSQGKDNWRTVGFQSTFEIIDGVAVNTEVNTTKSFITGDYIQFSSGNKIYISFILKVSDFTSVASIRAIGGVGGNPPLATVTNPTNNDFNNYSAVLDWEIGKQIRINLVQIAGTPNVVVSLKSLLAIDLTKTFGKGNEPTKEEMDELIKVIGYIGDEYALNNKEMLIWALTLIRRNKNAIITMGGTI